MAVARRLPPLAAIIVLLTQSSAAAEPLVEPPQLVFAGDPAFGMEGGVLTSLSLFRLVSRYDLVFAAIELDEGEALGKATAIAGRSAKLFFIDFPLAEFSALLAHEVYGHGARAREQGQNPIYHFQLIPPYGWFLSGAGLFLHGIADTELVHSSNPERDLPLDFGGIEANQLTAAVITQDLVERQGAVRSTELLLYLSKLEYSERFLFADLSKSLDSDSDDAARYVTGLQRRFNRWRPSDRAAIAHNLRGAYLYTLLDPSLYLAAYHLVVSYLIMGESSVRFPLISIGEVELFPATRLNLTPFGAEHYLEIYFRLPWMVLRTYARVGSSGLASYFGGGVSVSRLALLDSPALVGAAEIDAWDQPQILLDERNVFDRPNRGGLSVALRAELDLIGPLGVLGKLGFKSSGYLMGQPLEGGVYGFVGISLRLAQ